MLQLLKFTGPGSFLLLTIVMFVIVIGRYFLIAGIFQLWFYVWNKEKWSSRRLSSKDITKQQFYKEVKWSMITSFIFASIGALTALLWQLGYTQIYTDINAFPLWYLPVSLLLSMFIHETYYYWLHRWMHQPKVFKVLHKVHHDSKTTSAWTAFSFHPLEGLLQAIILPITILFLPIHIYVLLFQLTLMTLSSVINHLEIELYPGGQNKFSIGKWLIGATHHSLHHKQYKYNFGLYFTFWDKWKRTESPLFKSLFQEKTIKRAVKQQ